MSQPLGFALAAILGLASSAFAQLPPACVWEWETVWAPEAVTYGRALEWTGSGLLVWQVGKSRAPRPQLYDPRSRSWQDAGFPADVHVNDAPYPVQPVRSGRSDSEIAFFVPLLWNSEAAGGAIFRPESGSWRPISAVGAKRGQIVVWAGWVYLVWGGKADYPNPDEWLTGGMYDPVLDRWASMSPPPLPAAPERAAAVWNGSAFWVVTNGEPAATMNRFLAFDPSTNSWTDIGPAPAIAAERDAIWTGEEMVVDAKDQKNLILLRADGTWRSIPVPERQNDDETADSWERMFYWNRQIVLSADMWDFCVIPECGVSVIPEWFVYDLDTEAWSTVLPTDQSNRHQYFSVALADDGRAFSLAWNGDVHTLSIPELAWHPADWAPNGIAADSSVTWTGRELVVIGGTADGRAVAGGIRFDPVTRAARPPSTENARPRAGHVAVWAGESLLVFGGGARYEAPESEEVQHYFPGGESWNPDTDTWTPLLFTGQPPLPRIDASGVWTGTELVVVGGEPHPDEWESCCSAGFRYSPATGEWRVLAENFDIAERRFAVSAWTGEDVLLWGERDSPNTNSQRIDGFLYDPDSDQWQQIPPSPLPVRGSEDGVWTGRKLLVWSSGAVRLEGKRYVQDWQFAVFDPSASSWRQLPAFTYSSPDRFYESRLAAIRMDSSLLLTSPARTWNPWEERPLDIAIELDPETGETRPIAFDPRFGARPEALWTGAEVLAWRNGQLQAMVANHAAPGRPQVVAPTNYLELKLPISFAWAPSANAASYDFLLGNWNDAEPVVQDTKFTSCRIEDLPANREFYYRIDARNACGTTGSEWHWFTTAPFFADFDAPVSAKTWSGVAFEDRSTGHPIAWRWEFGDGVTATVAAPRHVFTQPGRYEVRLTVTAEEGVSSISRSIEIGPDELTLRRAWSRMLPASGTLNYRTELRLANEFSYPLVVRAALRLADGSERQRELALAPREIRIWPDVVADIFQADTSHSTVLHLDFPEGQGYPISTLRRWRAIAGGAVGADYPLGYEFSRRFRGLGRVGSRVELHLAAASDQPSEIRIKTFDDAGTRGERMIDLEPGQLLSLPDIAAEFGLDENEVFDIELSGQLVDARCFVVDTTSGDLIVVPNGAETVRLVASIAGIDAHRYRTRWAVGTFTHGSFTARFLPRGANRPTATRQIGLVSSQAAKIFEDVLPDLFGLYDAAGWLSCDYNALSWGEVWTDGPIGRVGTEAGRTGWFSGSSTHALSGISEDAAFRTNLWIGAAENSEVVIQVRDGAGNLLAEQPARIPAGGRLFSSVVRHFGIEELSEGWIDVIWKGPTSLDAWATVIDRATLDARIVD